VSSAGMYRQAADTIIAYAMGTTSYAGARRRLLARFPCVVVRMARVALAG